MPDPVADLIVVGAGISGLSTAIEASQAGLSVLVLDKGSVFGGHAVVSAGVLNIPVSPMQADLGISDSYTLAKRDFLTWGETANEPWVERYLQHARTDIYDWAESLGLEFSAVVQPPGNSVPRVHVTEGAGLALVTAIYREVLAQPNIQMRWNSRVDDILMNGSGAAGVYVTDTRSAQQLELYADTVVIATGGFQSNLEMVRANWPADMLHPDRLLAGSGIHSLGSGLTLAETVGANIEHLDYQWNYITGIPNPAYEESNKGLSLFILGGQDSGVFINTEGQRFTNECLSPKYNLPRVLEQPNKHYWYVFDQKNKPKVGISGPGWTPERMNREIFSNPEITKVSDSIAGLAVDMGLDSETLQLTIEQFNRFVSEGEDGDHERFSSNKPQKGCALPSAIDSPPYYAIRRYPLARKSMGGIQIDLNARVLARDGSIIPGLYAVGEATGFAGINGKAGLEGTFLGPSIVTGRVAGRSISAKLQKSAESQKRTSYAELPADNFSIHQLADGNGDDCTGCHQLADDINIEHSGYEHFGYVHNIVLEREYPCAVCHADFYPYEVEKHQIDSGNLANACVYCHGGGD